MKTLRIVLLAVALGGIVHPAYADPTKSAGTVHEVFKQSMPTTPGSEVIVVTVDYAPGESTPPHEHPGATFAYVLKGAVVSQLGDEPPHTYTEGQMWSETPHQHHTVSKNASATEPAKLLVFFMAPKGEKLTTMLPAKP
jgi:quercetin dioxygenase-like cupin family protein